MNYESGELIRRARAKLGITVRELAGQVRKKDGTTIGPSYVTDLEKGRGIPSPFVARNFARALGIDPMKLLAACDKDRSRLEH